MREIGLAGAALLILALALQSCRASHYSDKADELRGSLATKQGQVDACSKALVAVDAATIEAQAEAARRERAGQQAAQAALQAAREAGERHREAERALAEARRDPTCAEQLEVRLCPAIPLL